MQSQLTYAEAVELWLEDRRGSLSEASERAYRGEVGRLAAFAASSLASLRVDELSEAGWLDYLAAMSRDRSSISPRRSDILASGSLDQARRITAIFLRWLQEHGVISWVPRRAPAKGSCKARSPIVQPLSENKPARAREFTDALSGNAAVLSSMKELRANLVLNFAYWGGLTASEISQLKVGNVQVLPRKRGLQVEIDTSHSLPLQPPHVADLWRKYLAARAELEGNPPASGPAIARLRASGPVSSWAVWAILKDWEKSFGGTLTSRTIRREYLDARLDPARQELERVAHYMRCTHIDYVSVNASTVD